MKPTHRPTVSGRPRLRSGPIGASTSAGWQGPRNWPLSLRGLARGVGERQPESCRGCQQFAATGHQDHLVVGDTLSSCEVVRVVAAQGVELREFTSPTNQAVIDLDHGELVAEVVEADSSAAGWPDPRSGSRPRSTRPNDRRAVSRRGQSEICEPSILRYFG